MKYLKLFNNEIDYDTWLKSDDFITPYVSKNKDNNYINYQKRLPLPYDKKIEYLESTGYQHIITELYGNENIGFEVKFNFSSTSSPEDSNSTTIFGARHSPSSNGLQVSAFHGGTVQYAGSLISGLAFNEINIDYIVKLLDNGIYVNDSYRTTLNNNEFITPNYITLFALNQNGTIIEHLSGKIYYVKFFNKLTLETLGDFIPVRKNGIGYMYDKISNKLFSNQGTGEFILGPDK